MVAAVAGAAESVHLASWPVADESLVDRELTGAMGQTRRLVELGRSARSEAKVKTRQPLRRVLVPSASYARLTDELIAEIAAELNVEAVESFASAGDLVDYGAKGNFRALGRRFGKRTPLVAEAIATADAAALVASLADTGEAILDVDGGTTVSADEVLISERPRAGWSVVNEQGETVALDLELTPELIQAGYAREVVRTIQEARKTSGFEVSDRIAVQWSTQNEKVAEALRANAELVAREVLATSVLECADPAPGWDTDADLGLSFSLAHG